MSNFIKKFFSTKRESKSIAIIAMFLVCAIVVSLVTVTSVRVSASTDFLSINVGLNKETLMAKEIVELRQETSKTFDLGGQKRELVISGVQHYKDNYADKSELWKDIDLTFVNGRIDKAPYILEVNGLTVTLTSKRTGTVQTLTLDTLGTDKPKVTDPFVFSGNTATWVKAAKDTDVVIVASPEGFSYKRILKSIDAPLVAEYLYTKVVGTSDDIVIQISARDADGQSLDIVKSDIAGKITESIDSSKVDLSKVKYPIEIDPSPLIVGSAKDTFLDQVFPKDNNSSLSYVQVYNYPTGNRRTLGEFDISGLPAGQTLTSGSLQLYYYLKGSNDPKTLTVWAYKQMHTDWVEAEATWNIYKGDKTEVGAHTHWTTAAGDYVTSNPAGGSTTFPANFGWMSWDALSICQNAYAGSIPAEFLVKFETEDAATSTVARFYSKEYTTDTTLRPKLTIAYTPAASYDISNTGTNPYDFGIVVASSTNYAHADAPSNPVDPTECTWTLTNNGNACDLDMNMADFTGGVGWNIEETAGAPGENEVKLVAYYNGQDPAAGLLLKNADQEFLDSFGASPAHIHWDFTMTTGTFTDGVAKSGVLTITARAHS